MKILSENVSNNIIKSLTEKLILENENKNKNKNIELEVRRDFRWGNLCSNGDPGPTIEGWIYYKGVPYEFTYACTIEKLIHRHRHIENTLAIIFDLFEYSTDKKERVRCLAYYNGNNDGWETKPNTEDEKFVNKVIQRLNNYMLNESDSYKDTVENYDNDNNDNIQKPQIIKVDTFSGFYQGTILSYWEAKRYSGLETTLAKVKLENGKIIWAEYNSDWGRYVQIDKDDFKIFNEVE